LFAAIGVSLYWDFKKFLSKYLQIFFFAIGLDTDPKTPMCRVMILLIKKRHFWLLVMYGFFLI
jgi:hypothetical protein